MLLKYADFHEKLLIWRFAIKRKPNRDQSCGLLILVLGIVSRLVIAETRHRHRYVYLLILKWKLHRKTTEIIYNLYDNVWYLLSYRYIACTRITSISLSLWPNADAQKASSLVRSLVRLHAPPPPPHYAYYITQKSTNPPRRRNGPIRSLLLPAWLRYLL